MIACTSMVQGQFLHFGVRRAAFDPSNPDVFRGSLPPEGTTGCLPCYGRPLPLPAFPEQWEDPARLFRNPSDFAELLEGGEEGGGDVLEMPDGYLVGGWTRAANIGGTGKSDMWLVRLDPEGHILSQRAYGGPGVDEIRRLQPTGDGGFVALAHTGSFGPGLNSPMLLKFDATAEHIEWQTIYVASSRDWANDLRVTSDGGYVIAGATDSHQATVVKLDAGGAVQWAKSFDSFLGKTDAFSIVETADGGYVVAATVNPGYFGRADLLVFRLDSTGHQVWKWILGDDGDNTPEQIEATSDGGFAIVGTKDLDGGYFKGLWFLKMRSDGTVEQEAVYETLGGEAGLRILPTSDGGYVVAGRAYLPNSTGPHLWILRLDVTGNIVRQRAFDGRGAFNEATGLRSTRDGGFIITGGQDNTCSLCTPDVSPSNFVVVKMNADFEVSKGCGVDTKGFRYSHLLSPATPQEFLREQPLTVSTSPTGVEAVDTGAKVYACDGGSYGPPPVFESASAQLSTKFVACDFTGVIEGTLCSLGAPGALATLPVILSGSYDTLSIEARVTDTDSTVDRSDIVEVHAGLTQSGATFPIPVKLLDDGSSQIVLQPQMAIIGEKCFDDPTQGICVCNEALYPTSSGDLVPSDSLFTHWDNLAYFHQSGFLADWPRRRTTRTRSCSLQRGAWTSLCRRPITSGTSRSGRSRSR